MIDLFDWIFQTNRSLCICQHGIIIAWTTTQQFSGTKDAPFADLVFCPVPPFPASKQEGVQIQNRRKVDGRENNECSLPVLASASPSSWKAGVRPRRAACWGWPEGRLATLCFHSGSAFLPPKLSRCAFRVGGPHQGQPFAQAHKFEGCLPGLH